MPHAQIDIRDHMKTLVAALSGFSAAVVATSEADLGTIEATPRGAVFLDEMETDVVSTSSTAFVQRTQTITVMIADSSAAVEETLLDHALALERSVYVARKQGDFGATVTHAELSAQNIERSPESDTEGHITQSYVFSFNQTLI
jgi:hypothetical protein